MGRLSSIICLVLTFGVNAQERVDTARYGRYVQAYRSDQHEQLRTLGEEFSRSSDAWVQRLSLIAHASHAYRSDDIKRCLALLDSLDGTTPEDFILIRALTMKLRALVLKRVMALPRAEEVILQGIALIRPTDHRPELADMIIIQAEIERKLDGRIDQALAHLQEAEHIAERVGHDYGLANVLINRGNIYYSQDRLQEAWAAYQATLRFASERGYVHVANNAIMNLGAVAHLMDRYDEAIALYDSLLGVIGGRNPDLRVDLLTNMGFAHAAMGRHDQALAWYDLALKELARHGSDVRDAKLLQHRSSSFWKLGRREAAFHDLNEALSIADQQNWKELEAEIRYKLYRWYKETGRAEEALLELEAYTALNDSLSEIRFGERMSRLEVQYETEKKEQRLKLQEAELSETRAREERRSFQLKGVIGLLVLLVVIAALLMRNVRHIRRLRGQEQAMHLQQVDDLMKKQEIRVLDAVVQAQHEERDRIAKDLHDHLGQMLSAIKLQFSALEGRVEGMAAEHKEHYRHVFDLLDKAVTEVRRISHSMVKGTLARFGLKGALEDLAATVETPDKLHVELSLFGLEERLKPEVELGIYRMVQEMVSNILKHARATEVTIQVTRSAGMLNLMVEDNGVGFEQGKAKEGLGMGNLRTRAGELKGALHIDSRPGQGTTLSVDIPLG